MASVPAADVDQGPTMDGTEVDDNLMGAGNSDMAIKIVTEPSKLPNSLLKPSRTDAIVIGFDCQGIDGISILLLALPDAVYLVDAIKGGQELVQACKIALESIAITKVIHDCRRHSKTLFDQYGIRLRNVMDTQVLYSVLQERKWEKPEHDRISLFAIRRYHEMTCAAEQRLKMLPCQEWARRPLSKVMIEMARDYVCFLPALHAIIIKNLSKSSLWQVAVQSDELSRHYYSPISVMFGPGSCLNDEPVEAYTNRCATTLCYTIDTELEILVATDDGRFLLAGFFKYLISMLLKRKSWKACFQLQNLVIRNKEFIISIPPTHEASLKNAFLDLQRMLSLLLPYFLRNNRYANYISSLITVIDKYSIEIDDSDLVKFLSELLGHMSFNSPVDNSSLLFHLITIYNNMLPEADKIIFEHAVNRAQFFDESGQQIDWREMAWRKALLISDNVSTTPVRKVHTFFADSMLCPVFNRHFKEHVAESASAIQTPEELDIFGHFYGNFTAQAVMAIFMAFNPGDNKEIDNLRDNLRRCRI
ncbi:uncharacterized protein [Triticum aestivum]|uniref:uncharacterized protein isoform X2 n=1 Tax=Triticum aestivum TaxID=4565 RepID=UPI000844B088|nr:uncharacterized protein LOC123136905 isoform X2 [Triticum aestivum]